MLTDALIFSLASAFALFILLVKLNIRRVLGYDVLVDIACTAILLWSFKGTVTGMAAAMIGAVTISLLLFAIKLLIGFERLERHGWRFHWVRYHPQWRLDD